MSYTEQGTVGLLVGIGLILVLFRGGFLSILGILLVIFSLMTISYGKEQVAPGTMAKRCSTWGHDWRDPLPGIPPGKTCRNCLYRKDGLVLAWRQWVPPGVQPLVVPSVGLFVAAGSNKVLASGKSKAFVLLDLPGTPTWVPGQPFPSTGTPQMVMQAQAAAMPAAVPRPTYAAPAAARPMPERLCSNCFATVPAGVAICPACGKPA